MTVIKHNPHGVYPPYRCYSHAIELRGDSRLLIISGINGYLHEGKVLPESFEEQAEAVWMHLRAILRAASMDYDDLVSLRTYLADPKYDEANVRLRVQAPETLALEFRKFWHCR